jgi:hypothetical protein
VPAVGTSSMTSTSQMDCLIHTSTLIKLVRSVNLLMLFSHQHCIKKYKALGIAIKCKGGRNVGMGTINRNVHI